MLQVILEQSSKWKILNLVLWRISEIDTEFSLDEEIDYKIQVLGLKHTIHKYDPKLLCISKLRVLLKNLAKTTLVHSLSTIFAIDDHYDFEDLTNIFDEYGFDVSVHV